MSEPDYAGEWLKVATHYAGCKPCEKGPGQRCPEGGVHFRGYVEFVMTRDTNNHHMRPQEAK